MWVGGVGEDGRGGVRSVGGCGEPCGQDEVGTDINTTLVRDLTNKTFIHLDLESTLPLG